MRNRAIQVESTVPLAKHPHKLRLLVLMWLPRVRCCRRQQTRISAIEAELQRLQREMAGIKLENERLKAKVG